MKSKFPTVGQMLHKYYVEFYRYQIKKTLKEQGKEATEENIKLEANRLLKEVKKEYEEYEKNY